MFFSLFLALPPEYCPFSLVMADHEPLLLVLFHQITDPLVNSYCSLSHSSFFLASPFWAPWGPFSCAKHTGNNASRLEKETRRDDLLFVTKELKCWGYWGKFHK